MKKKVALMVFSNSMGGAEGVVKEIIKNIPTDSIDLYMITNEEIKDEFVSLLTSKKVYSIGNLFSIKGGVLFNRIVNKLNSKFGIFNYKKSKLDSSVKTLVGFLKENKINTVHAHLGLDMYLLSELKKVMQNDLFSIFTMHGSLGLDPEDSYKTFFKKEVLLKQLSRFDYYTSACHYFLSILSLNNIKIENKSRLIENGVDKESVEKFLNKNIQNDKIELVYLGGERHLKGPDILLNAIGILVNESKIMNFKLNVLREINSTSSFRKLVSELKLTDYINYVGYVSSPNHLENINNSDIFVLPSRTEGIANTLMEAIGMEKSIVATKVGGTPELVIDGQNGLLSSTDPIDLALKLKLLIENEELRKKFENKNKELKEKYYWDSVAKKYENLYLNRGEK